MRIQKQFPSRDWEEDFKNLPYPQKVAALLNESVVFNFPDGIPAFENSRRYIILLNEKIKPFIYLKSLDSEDLGFVCIDPFLICPRYSIQIPAKDLSLLDLKDSANALILSLVTVENRPEETTANLLAPIIINIANQTGRQVILEDNKPVRFKIWEGLEAFEKMRNN